MQKKKKIFNDEKNKRWLHITDYVSYTAKDMVSIHAYERDGFKQLMNNNSA